MKSRIVRNVGAGAILVALGTVLGLLVPGQGLRSVVADRLFMSSGTDTAAREQQPDGHDVHDHLMLTDTARRNMGLRTRQVRIRAFTRSVRVPAVVRERPAYSDLTISSRVHGIITKVYAVPGQAVRGGESLFDVELTGEALATAQATLLDSLQQLEITDAELKRLGPAAERGSVAARTRLQLEYERKRMDAQRQVRNQELLLRGLTNQQITQIVSDKRLLNKLTVSMPTDVEEFLAVHDADPVPVRQDETEHSDAWHFTVEELHTHPGRAVKPGDALCDVAHHTTLYLEGQAFEKDITAITSLERRGWRVQVQFGTKGDGPVVDDLHVVYLDNHVDSETQTFRFYVPLQNEVMQDIWDDRGAMFRSWRYKPGQRAHILIPAEELTGGMPVPVAAIVDEGPESFVFRRAAHDHSHGAADGHAHGNTVEFEPVPVAVIHRDTETAVLAADGELEPGDRIAINNAYLLHLAMKAGDGGGHDHQH